MKELLEAADLFAVGELYSEDLPMVAANALTRGLDSPSLVELACMSLTDCRDAPDLFVTALHELGLIDAITVDWPRRESAVLLNRARRHAADLLDDRADPLMLSGRIAALLVQLAYAEESAGTGLIHLAQDFESLNMYWEDGLGHPDTIIDQIRQACRLLLGGPPYESVFSRSNSPGGIAVEGR